MKGGPYSAVPVRAAGGVLELDPDGAVRGSLKVDLERVAGKDDRIRNERAACHR